MNKDIRKPLGGNISGSVYWQHRYQSNFTKVATIADCATSIPAIHFMFSTLAWGLPLSPKPLFVA